MKPQLKKIWLNDNRPKYPTEIRIDWDNDRHHAIQIKKPCEKDQVVDALIRMAWLIDIDPNL